MSFAPDRVLLRFGVPALAALVLVLVGCPPPDPGGTPRGGAGGKGTVGASQGGAAGQGGAGGQVAPKQAQGGQAGQAGQTGGGPAAIPAVPGPPTGALAPQPGAPATRSFRFPAKPAAPAVPGQQEKGAVEAPMSLTASDGTGLKLVRLKARGVLEEPLAFTELTLAFENTEARTREGRFRIALPPNASISRFAMKIGGRWQEGEVVERQRARQIYEDFLHRKQDPALLEQQAGNEFTARVFPIPPRAIKELIISYSQELTRADQRYAIPLQGLPELGELDIRVLRSKAAAGGGGAASSLGGSTSVAEHVQVNRRAWTPDRDFELDQAGVAERLGLRHDNLVVARVTPVLGGETDELDSLFVLLDTSASRALGFDRQVSRVARLIEGLAAGAGPQTPVAVACFDQRTDLVYEGTAGGFGEAQRAAILQRQALGASDLHGALSWLAGHLGGQGKRYHRVLLVTDGVATAGQTEGDALRTVAQGLRAAEVERLDVLAVGGIRDDAGLKRLATAGLARDGVVLRPDQDLQEIARRLSLKTRSGVKVQVQGAKWVWPTELNGLQAGDEVLIYADLPSEQAFSLGLGGVAMKADRRKLATVARPVLERAWIKARMARIEHQRVTLAAGDDDLREALRQQVIKLSVRHRVLSTWTALLVLETERDYRRYNIDRNALADILTVGAEGVTVLRRSAETVMANVRADTVRRRGPRGGDGRDRGAEPTAVEKAEEAPGSRPEAEDSDDEAQAAAPPKRRPRRSPPRRAFSGRKGGAAAPSGRAEGLGLRGTGSGGGGVADSVVGASGGQPAAGATATTISAAPPAAPVPQPAEVARLAEQPAASPPTDSAIRRVRGERRPRPSRRPPRRPPPPPRPPSRREDKSKQVDPYTGTYKQIMDLLAGRNTKAALAKARKWRDGAVGDVMALVALGEAYEAAGDRRNAARAYGSLIDLFPSRADMRRFAGERLERLGAGDGLNLALDTYRKAVEQRPDHPASHRLLAFSLLKAGKHREAFAALSAGAKRQYPAGRFAGVTRILKEDLGLVAAAWIKAEPARAEEIRTMTRAAGAQVEQGPSLRFVLNWETDANDVDFHIRDGKGNHAYYGHRELASGGNLYADVTTGYGPECFTIRKPPKQRTYPYRLQAHYYSRGPMGYGMGKLQVIEHDGKGGLAFVERPFVVMQDRAFLDLGAVAKPLKI